jgi:hypothetical protein
MQVGMRVIPKSEMMDPLYYDLDGLDAIVICVYNETITLLWSDGYCADYSMGYLYECFNVI